MRGNAWRIAASLLKHCKLEHTYSLWNWFTDVLSNFIHYVCLIYEHYSSWHCLKLSANIFFVLRLILYKETNSGLIVQDINSVKVPYPTSLVTCGWEYTCSPRRDRRWPFKNFSRHADWARNLCTFVRGWPSTFWCLEPKSRIFVWSPSSSADLWPRLAHSFNSLCQLWNSWRRLWSIRSRELSCQCDIHLAKLSSTNYSLLWACFIWENLH